MTEPPPTDEQYHVALYRTFDLADELMVGTNAGTLWPDVLPGSSMESDNAETEPHQMAHLIETPLNSAIEHLHATAGLVRRAGLLHNAPPFTLCRAAVETAANAYWLLCADDEKKRLWRHLVCVRQDTFDYEQVSQLVADRVNQPVNAAEFAEPRAWADKVKAKHHLTGLPNKMDINRMIAEVDAGIAVQDGRENDHHIETYWKSASGFIHGRQWATLNLLVREEVLPIGNATATIKLGNTQSRVLWGAAAAYELINRSWHLYHRACGHEIPAAGVGEEATRSSPGHAAG
jgi:hypothetical protein